MKKIMLTIMMISTIGFITSCAPGTSSNPTTTEENTTSGTESSSDSSILPSTPTTDESGKPSLPATIPAYYGNVADYEIYGGDGRDIKTHLSKIISNNARQVGYDNLWSAYWKTDVRSDGTLWDMYGEYHFKKSQKDSGSGGSVPGERYNREHSVPQSWFYEAEPTKSDLFHVYPTDKKINNTRGNYMFGEVDDSVALDSTEVGDPVGNREGNEFGKIDEAYIASGISKGTIVFEPREIYKGDFARSYFYMATRYQNDISDWQTGNHFTGNRYPSLSQYSINLFLKWAHDDPVSEKEIKRNEEVYKIQNNRNPFIDVPEFAEIIWGDLATIEYK